MKTIYRQGKDNLIIKNANNVNDNKELELKKNTDFTFNLINGNFQFNSYDKDYQILCDMRIGKCGTNVINSIVQDKINPNGKQIVSYGKVFRENDKVIQTRNNSDKEIFNGEIGFIEEIEDNAITIHKSQGSEFPKVMMFISDNKEFVSKQIVYTGMTRAKKNLIMYSYLNEQEIANLHSSNTRATNLCDLLKAM